MSSSVFSCIFRSALALSSTRLLILNEPILWAFDALVGRGGKGVRFHLIVLSLQIGDHLLTLDEARLGFLGQGGEYFEVQLELGFLGLQLYI